MKKALAGPAKRPAKKKPERRAMIAATRRRLRALPRVAGRGRRRATRTARPRRQPPHGPGLAADRAPAAAGRRDREALGALGRPPPAPGRRAPPARLLVAGTAAAAGTRPGDPGRDPGQRGAHPRTGDLRGDRRRGGLPRRLPVRRLPRGRGRAARVRGPAGAPPRRSSASKPPGAAHAYLLAPVGALAVALAAARRLRPGATGSAGSSSSSASSAWPSSSSSTGPPGSTPAPRRRASRGRRRCCRTASTPSWPRRRA